MFTLDPFITLAEISPINMMWALVLLILTSAVTIGTLVVRQVNAERDRQRDRAERNEQQLERERLSHNDDRHNQIVTGLKGVNRSVEKISDSVDSLRGDLHDMRRDQESLREEVGERFGQVEHRVGRLEKKVGGEA